MEKITANVEFAFQRALEGPDGQVVLIQHPVLRIYARNRGGHASLRIRATNPFSYVPLAGRGFDVDHVQTGGFYCLDITCGSAEVSPSFRKLVELVLEAAATGSGESESQRRAGVAVDSFRQFMATQTGALSARKARGLFAELKFLQLLADHIGIRSALLSWKGPYALEGLGRHDFVLPNGVGVESKSMPMGADKVVISSETQLIPSGTQLGLVVLPLERDDAGLSLGLLAQELGLSAGADAPDTARMWSDAFSALGVDPHDDALHGFAYRFANWRCFVVAEGFPYIDLESIPRGICDVRYSIELAHLGEFGTTLPQLLPRSY